MCISTLYIERVGGCKIWSTNIILHVHVCYRVLIAKTAIHLGIKCQKCAATEQSLSILLKIESSKKKKKFNKLEPPWNRQQLATNITRVIALGEWWRQDGGSCGRMTSDMLHSQNWAHTPPPPHPRDPCRYTQPPRPL